jgi:DNA invertase Pin-like site-specific DNA recombinase
MPTYFYYAAEDVVSNPETREFIAKTFGIARSDDHVVLDLLDRKLPALQRPGLADLAKRLSRRSKVYCTTLDQIGNDVDDISQTLNRMQHLGVQLYCLEIGKFIDLAGKRSGYILAAIAAYAKVMTAVRGSLVRRGQKRSRSIGGSVGRRVELPDEVREALLNLLASGSTVLNAAAIVGIDRSAVYRLMKREGLRPRMRETST